MISNENLKHQIDAELIRELYKPALVNTPPTELTKLLLYLDLTDTRAATQFVEKIAGMVNKEDLWHTSLIEVLAVFVWQDNQKDLYPALLRHLYTSSSHKFSAIFGHKTRLQSLVCKHLQSHLTGRRIRNLSPYHIYNFLTLAYCVNIETFRRLLNQIASEISVDSIIDPQSRRLHTENNAPQGTQISISEENRTHSIRSETKKKLNIAICVSGQLRGYRHFHSSLAHLNLVDHSYQIFVSTWEKVGGRFPHLDQAHRIFPERFAASFRNVTLNLGEQTFRQRYPTLIQLIENPSRVTSEQLTAFYNTKYLDLQDDETDPFKSFSSITKMHYKLGRCLEMLAKHPSKFDLVIRMRPDLEFSNLMDIDWFSLYQESLSRRLIFSDFDARISPRIINWQIGEVLPLMIGDLFAVGTLDVMQVYMDSFNENIRLIDKSVPGLPKGFMPHTTLSRILMYHNIGVATFPQVAITDKNLAEFSILNDVLIGEALQKDAQGRPYDQFDKHLLGALDFADSKTKAQSRPRI